MESKIKATFARTRLYSYLDNISIAFVQALNDSNAKLVPRSHDTGLNIWALSLCLCRALEEPKVLTAYKAILIYSCRQQGCRRADYIMGLCLLRSKDCSWREVQQSARTVSYSRVFPGQEAPLSAHLMWGLCDEDRIAVLQRRGPTLAEARCLFVKLLFTRILGKFEEVPSSMEAGCGFVACEQGEVLFGEGALPSYCELLLSAEPKFGSLKQGHVEGDRQKPAAAGWRCSQLRHSRACRE